MSYQQDSYTLTARLLHWIIALLVLVLFGLGWFMVDLPKGPERGYYFALHKSIGLTVFGLMIIRLFWRWMHTPPPLPLSVPIWKRQLAHFAHVCLYTLLLVQPLSGYISSSFSGYKTRYFGIPLPNWGWKDQPVNESFTEIHVIGSLLLVGIVIAHIVGAVGHLLIEKDGVFQRMWFFTRQQRSKD